MSRSGVTGIDLSRMAELRLWTLLINEEETLAGLPAPRVVAAAQARAAHLDDQLAEFSPAARAEALEGASERERDAAYVEAGRAMSKTLRLVSLQLDLAAAHHTIHAEDKP